MSGLIRRTAALALNLTGYSSSPSPPVSGDGSTPSTVAPPARLLLPPSETSFLSSDPSLDVPPSSSTITHAFSPETALPGVSEDALRDTVAGAATSASGRGLRASVDQLTSVMEVLVRAVVQRPRSNDQGFWDRFYQARTVEEVGSALTTSTAQVFNTSTDVGRLRARLESSQVSYTSLEDKLRIDVGFHENSQLFAQQATAEINELKAELRRVRDSDAAHLKRTMDAQATLEAHEEVVARLQQFVSTIRDENNMLEKPFHRYREMFKAKVAANTSLLNKLHRLLSDLIHGDFSDVLALQTKVSTKHDRIERLMRANAILRQQVDLRALDADTLVLATEGIASGDLDLDQLQLDQSTL